MERAKRLQLQTFECHVLTKDNRFYEVEDEEELYLLLCVLCDYEFIGAANEPPYCFGCRDTFEYKVWCASQMPDKAGTDVTLKEGCPSTDHQN